MPPAPFNAPQSGTDVQPASNQAVGFYISDGQLEAAVFTTALWLHTFALLTLWKKFKSCDEMVKAGDMTSEEKYEQRRNICLAALLATLLFVFAAIHEGGVAARTRDGFLAYQIGSSTTEWFGELSNPPTMAAEVGQFGAVVMNDTISVTRLYMLRFGNLWDLVFLGVPICVTIASIVFGGLFLHKSAHASESGGNYQDGLEVSTQRFLALTVSVTAIYCVFTAARLWFRERESAREEAVSIKNWAKLCIVVLIQSAFPYLAVVGTYLGLFVQKRDGQSVPSTLIASVASISFSIINIMGDRVTKFAINRRSTRQTTPE